MPSAAAARVRRWGMALLAGGLLAGCGRPPASVRVVLENEVRTLDPHHHNEVVTWSLLSNFFDGLVRFDPEMRLQPALATHWEQVSPTCLRLHLRRGVRFHDGSPLTAADVAASVLRSRDHPASRIRHLLEGVRGVSAGEGVLEIHTAASSPTLLNRLALIFVVPRHHAALPEITAPLGTGAYRFAGRHPDGAVVGRAFAGWRGRPAVGEVVFTFLPDEGQRAERLLQGKADLVARLSPQAAEVLAARSDVRVLAQPRTAVQLLEFNAGHGEGATRRALQDLRVRRALLLATDRQRYVNVAYRGQGAVATQYVHPVVFGFDPAIPEAPYDPARAAQLLAEAGVVPREVELHLGFGAASAAVASLLAEDLRRLGLRVHLAQVPLALLVDRGASPHLTARLYGRVCTTGDAAELLNATFHSPVPDGTFGDENFTGYHDPETDRILQQASHELDPARRLWLLQRAQRRILEALPILPLTLHWGQTGVRAGLEFTPRHDQWLDAASFRWR